MMKCRQHMILNPAFFVGLWLAVVTVSEPAFAAEDVENLLAQAVAAQGPEYIEIRTRLEELAAQDLGPFESRREKHPDPFVRAMCGIVVERVTKGDEIARTQWKSVSKTFNIAGPPPSEGGQAIAERYGDFPMYILERFWKTNEMPAYGRDALLETAAALGRLRVEAAKPILKKAMGGVDNARTQWEASAVLGAALGALMAFGGDEALNLVLCTGVRPWRWQLGMGGCRVGA